MTLHEMPFFIIQWATTSYELLDCDYSIFGKSTEEKFEIVKAKNMSVGEFIFQA